VRSSSLTLVHSGVGLVITRKATRRDKDEPMKLTTMTQVTVDGVMQGNGGATDEDRRNGFERGGWAMGVFDYETMTFINQTYQRADAFLFGRRTYELFAGYWDAEERARARRKIRATTRSQLP
jgi:dihydrofolate reductase